MPDIEKLPEGWPLVLVNDNGIRPAGKPDECFYCQRKVGQPHGFSCVCVTKLVKIRYTVEAVVEVPWSWTQHDIEWHRNEGSWCSSNMVNDLKTDVERREAGDGSCLCPGSKAEYLGDATATPRGKAYEPPKENV